MASGQLTFHIHIHGATDLPRTGSVFGSYSVYVSIKADGEKVKTNALKPSSTGSVSWDFRTEVHCSRDAQQLEFQVKHVGLIGQHVYMGGCNLPIATLADIEDESLPLWDSSSNVIGHLRASIRREGGLVSRAPTLVNQATGSLSIAGGPRASSSSSRPPEPQLGGRSSTGLVNYAPPTGGLANHVPSRNSSKEEPEAPVQRMGTLGLANHADPAVPLPHSPERQGTVGLANHAEASGAIPYSVDRQGTVGLSNYAGGCAPLGPSRQGTVCLPNQAEAAEDGSRPNALPRACELLAGLSSFQPESGDDRQTLAQAVEQLRHVAAQELQSNDGKEALQECTSHIKAVFESALSRNDDKDMGAALSLAGRLPLPDDDADVTLQNTLRQKWNAWKMTEALLSAQSLVGDAARGGEPLENLMDQLDLAEFHARLANEDPQPQLRALLTQLQPHIQSSLKGLMQSGRWDEVESTIGILGAARVDALQLHSVQLELQRAKGVDLLRNALLPFAGQIGFPELKRRQLRHAMMTVRTALGEDKEGKMAASLRKVLLGELLPACVAHSWESAEWALRTCFDSLHFGESEVWRAMRPAFDRLPSARKGELANQLPKLCGKMSRSAPEWLLSPEQVACQQAMHAALAGKDCGKIRAACQRVIETEGGQDLCQEEMRTAISRLRQEYQLPAGWDVEAMIGASHKRLLVKNEVSDPALLSLFDQLLKATAEPTVRTRDRRGSLPRNFSAVRAVQVMNADVWKAYVHRRDEVVAQCRKVKARHDVKYWRDHLNGPIGTMDVLQSRLSAMADVPPLQHEANEVWLLHGTSHAAAEGITSDDFDMTRASPTGLFGAGVYFAESSSKSDEYVEGRGSPELFPVLLCRVCLGHVFYCDERKPDRRELERKCLKDQWDSVLGDRKKTSGTFREFIIYDSLQAFPAYIIYYQRHF